MLAVTLGSVIAASLASRVVAAGLGLLTTTEFGARRYGAADASPVASLVGSSLTYDGVDWREVASKLGGTIESWPIPGSSPSEWEQMLARRSGPGVTFVGVSLYDLNEAWLCDFRPNIVPVGQTISDLRESGSDLVFSRRLLNGYTLAAVRTVFPTAGRADRVIFGVRDNARAVLGRQATRDETAPLRLAGDYTSEERLSDWPRDRFLRRLASMRQVQGAPAFFGPKHLALRRMVQEALERGPVFVIVLPVSRAYREHLMAPGDIARFEASLNALGGAVPGVRWVRLDRLASLESDDLFYDLVHLNMQGRRIASGALLDTLADVADAR